MSQPALPRRNFLSLLAAGTGAAVAAAEASPAEASPAEAAVAQPKTLRFKDTGRFPNSRLPVLVYAGALPARGDLAAAFEKRLAANSWSPGWRAGLFDYHHYHSTSHEALGVFSGSAQVRLGGPRGQLVQLTAGDLLILPAGTAHKNEQHSRDFRVVGAYPQGSSWDMQYGKADERPAADRRIARAAFPAADPLNGSAGPLRKLWR